MLQLNQLPNGFDNVVVDVPALYRDFPVEAPVERNVPWKSPIGRLYSNPLLPLSVRNYAWFLLRRLRLDQTWFDRYRHYWGKVVGARPLWGVEDFYFLRNIYRMRFQSAAVPDTQDGAVHLEAWQRPEVISHLFHSVYKESLTNELRLLRPMRQLHRGPVKSILEFGCGCAPVTTSLCEFFGTSSGVEAWISDIETMSFHYAAHKLAPFPNVRALPLKAANRFRFPEPDRRFDVIFCMTVLEHLQEPLAIVEHFHGMLAPGGLLFFDYVKSDAGGLDTQAGLDQRPAVLAYIEKNFRILSGKLDPDEGMGVTIVEKRS